MQLRVPLHVVLAVVGGAGATNSSAAAPAQIEADLRKLDAGWERAVAAKDLEKVLSFYADETSGLYEGRPIVTGKAAMRKVWQQILARPDLDLHWTPTHIEVAKSADLAYDVGTIAMSTKDPNGNIVNFVGKYVVVWKKTAAGQWQVAVDISNSDRAGNGSSPGGHSTSG
jgi:ketosteroid isomerase-like protein